MASISHHYNPQVYLRQFAHKKEFWEYDLTTGMVKKSTPKVSGCEDFYHSFVGSDGQCDDDTLEKSFSSFENRLPELFKAIRIQKPISDELVAVFFWFAAIQRARSPKMIASIQKGLKKLHEARWEIVKHTPDFERWMTARGLEPDKVRETEFDITPSRGRSLIMMLDRSEKLALRLAKMNWEFLSAPPDKYFFTSDDPVCCRALPETGRLFGAIGPADTEVEITFPISRRICAFGSWQQQVPDGFQHGRALSANEVDEINGRTVRNGWHFIYGPTLDAHINKLVEETVKSRTLASQVKPTNLAT